MKYRVISVESINPENSTSGCRHLATYEVDTWSWRKFKVISTTKQAFRPPWQVRFRDAVTSERLDISLSKLIWSFIDLRDFKNDNTRSNLVQ